MRHTYTVLTALCLSFTLSACGLKGPLYLSNPTGAQPPVVKKAEPVKGGDDNKATPSNNPQEAK